MGFMDDIRSGKFNVYAKYLAWLTILLALILGIVALVGLNFWGIISIVIAVLMAFLELPFMSCMMNPTISKIVNFFRPNWIKALLYIGFAAIMWASLSAGGGVLIVIAILLTILALMNIIAAFKKEPVDKVGEAPGGVAPATGGAKGPVSAGAAV